MVLVLMRRRTVSKDITFVLMEIESGSNGLSTEYSFDSGSASTPELNPSCAKSSSIFFLCHKIPS